jgi:hypothetical protein
MRVITRFKAYIERKLDARRPGVRPDGVEARRRLLYLTNIEIAQENNDPEKETEYKELLADLDKRIAERGGFRPSI